MFSSFAYCMTADLPDRLNLASRYLACGGVDGVLGLSAIISSLVFSPDISAPILIAGGLEFLGMVLGAGLAIREIRSPNNQNRLLDEEESVTTPKSRI